MYRVILNASMMTSIDIDGDSYREDPSNGLRIYKGDRLVALFRHYVGVHPVNVAVQSNSLFTKEA